MQTHTHVNQSPSRTPVHRPAASGNPTLETLAVTWFAAGHEVLWLPMTPNLIQPVGSHRLLRAFDELYDLPMHIEGWLYPAHLNDTDVVVQRIAGGGLHFAHLMHRGTGFLLTHNAWHRLTRADEPGVNGAAAAQ